MSLFTPTNCPWKRRKQEEELDVFPIDSYPITSQKLAPCYVPDGLNTNALKFPSIVLGADRHPIHSARTALSVRYPKQKFEESLKFLNNQVSTLISTTIPITDKLDEIIKLSKERVKVPVKCNEKKNQDTYSQYLQLKLEKITLKFDEFMIENNKIQKLRFKLQNHIQIIDALLHISVECLYHREQRSKSELINDNVEQMLMKEGTEFRQKQQHMKNFVSECENKLTEGRNIQSELENIIKNIQWILFINKSIEEVKNALNSPEWTKQYSRLLEKLSEASKEFFNFQKDIETNTNKYFQEIHKLWHQTNLSFDENNINLQHGRTEIESHLDKIKDKILCIESQLRYLANKKEFHDDLINAEYQLELLLKTKEELQVELQKKIETFYINNDKCVSIRKSYPISIIKFD